MTERGMHEVVADAIFEHHDSASDEAAFAVLRALTGAGYVVVAARDHDEVERLRDIIGGLYMKRGRPRDELYTAIRAAFRDCKQHG